MQEMKRVEYTYMADCNKNGIRIYPVFKYGFYYLEVEFNKTSEFLRHEIIRTKPGEIKYSTSEKLWTVKILELYEKLYRTKVRPKLGAA